MCLGEEIRAQALEPIYGLQASENSDLAYRKNRRLVRKGRPARPQGARRLRRYKPNFVCSVRRMRYSWRTDNPTTRPVFALVRRRETGDRERRWAAFVTSLLVGGDAADRIRISGRRGIAVPGGDRALFEVDTKGAGDAGIATDRRIEPDRHCAPLIHHVFLAHR